MATKKRTDGLKRREVFLSDPDWQAVKNEAERKGVSPSEIVRRRCGGQKPPQGSGARPLADDRVQLAVSLEHLARSGQILCAKLHAADPDNLVNLGLERQFLFALERLQNTVLARRENSP